LAVDSNRTEGAGASEGGISSSRADSLILASRKGSGAGQTRSWLVEVIGAECPGRIVDNGAEVVVESEQEKHTVSNFELRGNSTGEVVRAKIPAEAPEKNHSDNCL